MELFIANLSYSYDLKRVFATYQIMRANRTSWAGTRLKSYDDGISGDTNNAVRAKAKRLWTAKIELQRLVKTVERAEPAFFKAVVEETWILPLKEETAFYNKVLLHDSFDRLNDVSSSLEATIIVSLLSAMLVW